MGKNLNAIFRPRTIALIGASNKRQKLSNVILRAIMDGDFTGRLYPVNPKADVIYCLPVYPSVTAIPDEVDLAIIVVPRLLVPGVLEECAQKGVKGVVVITAGFKEIGAEGAELEQKILKIVRRHNIRMVGPNCMGVINTESDVRMNATFSVDPPLSGKCALISQSGALGLAIIRYSRHTNVGLSKFISLGNRADVSSNDVLEFLEDDPNTDLILMYVESIGNPRRFVRVARRVTRKKPIVVVKSGRTAVGARAASSHTGALAGLDIAYDALFEQAGIIRAATIEEMFDIAKVMSEQPVPSNEDIIILSNGGGPAVLAADALSAAGISLPETSPKTRQELQHFLVGEASLVNPIDMTGNATPADFGKALEVICRNEKASTILVIFLPIKVTPTRAVVPELVRIKKQFPDKLILACVMAEESEEELQPLKAAEIPTFMYPEGVSAALRWLHTYHQWRSKPVGIAPPYDVDRERASRIIKDAYRSGRCRLRLDEALEILTCYGIKVAKNEVVNNADAAVEAAKKIGTPVVLKLVYPDVVHKTEMGAVAVDLRTEDEIRAAFERMAKGKPDAQVMVQQMVRGGRETIIGVTHDPNFGPLIMFGLGGIYVEVFKDVAFRLHPLTDIEAGEMIREMRSHKLLEGVRGEPPADINAIKDTLLRVSQLITDFHEIKEMDINPFMVQPVGQGGVAVDARFALLPATS